MNISKENKRLTSTKSYMDDLQEKYSKILVVRADFGYIKEDSSVTPEQAIKEFDKLLNNRRTKPSIFEHNVGYICKAEYTKDKGPHFHTVFFFDGNKVIKDKYKAEQLGEYWQNDITKGKGVFHNCNRNKYKDNGTGMLDYKDKQKRDILDNQVISYLCKDEQNIEPTNSNKKIKSFRKGTVKKSDEKKGRPREK